MLQIYINLVININFELILNDVSFQRG